MNRIYSLLTGTVFLLAGITVSAQQPENTQKENDKKNEQETISRQMTLEREYDPTVMDATKINTLPKVREMVIQKRPIVYSDYALPLPLDNEINVLPYGTYMTGIDRYANKGYLHVAGGMLMNFSGDFGYHLLSTERDDLRFHFSHRSTNGNVKFADKEYYTKILNSNHYYPEEGKAYLNDNVGGLDFKHAFDNLTLSLGGSFGYSLFNYYGIPTNGATALASSSLESSDYLIIRRDSTTNQGNSIVNIYAGIASNVNDKPGYRINFDFTSFDQKYSLKKDLAGMTENSAGLNFGLNSPVDNGRCFGADLNLKMLNYSAPQLPEFMKKIISDSVSFNNRYEITLSPYFRLDGEAVKLLLGVNLMLVSQEKTDAFVSPNIKIDVPFSTGSLFYVDLGGGIESNTMSRLSRINRYINPAYPPDASKTWFNGTLGVRSSLSSGFWLDIFGGYKYTEADVFFNPSGYSWIQDEFNNVSMVYQPNSSRAQLGASLKYSNKDVFGFYLNGTYSYYAIEAVNTFKNGYTGLQPVNKNEDLKPYGKPTLTLNAGVSVQPVAPLTLNLDYSLLSGMYAYNTLMKSVNDLRFKGVWKFNNTFSVYAQFNNLLFQRHEMYYGYTLQPFTAMAGLNINF